MEEVGVIDEEDGLDAALVDGAPDDHGTRRTWRTRQAPGSLLGRGVCRVDLFA